MALQKIKTTNGSRTGILIEEILSFILSFLVYYLNNKTDETTQVVRGQDKKYPLIRRLLDVEGGRQINEGKMLLLKRKIEEYTHEQETKGVLAHASVYIRDLNNGPWIGIGENDAFKPASLLKVPIMIGVFKLAEEDKNLLLRTVVASVSAESSVIQSILPSKSVTEGGVYTIEQLVEHMIIYSDNNAKDLLVSSLVDLPFDKVFYDLGIEVPGIQRITDDISVRKYAGFFRILYNASYLVPEYSQKSLELLQKSEFNAGLRAGVPKDIIIAHKFGEREFDYSSEKQLHDCGVVYTKNPYLICVMTRGHDLDRLSNAISFISKIAYEDLH